MRLFQFGGVVWFSLFVCFVSLLFPPNWPLLIILGDPVEV